MDDGSVGSTSSMSASAAAVHPPRSRRLTVLYDETCAVCLRSRDWLLSQPCRLPVELVPAGSAMARRRYGELPWLGQELIVADDLGNVWVGPAAFLTCLWATVRYRAWSYRLAGPALAPLTEWFFLHVSKRRDRWSAWLVGRQDQDCSWCDGVRSTAYDHEL
jgi:predicted DCC family thiol-disulfide oxidoreductase YuxK